MRYTLLPSTYSALYQRLLQPGGGGTTPLAQGGHAQKTPVQCQVNVSSDSDSQAGEQTLGENVEFKSKAE